MALPLVIEALDSIDENLREHYKPGEGELQGKFVLDGTTPSGVDLRIVPVQGLQSALTAEREAVKELKAKVKNFEGIDPDKARDALTRIEKFDSGQLDAKDKATLDKLKTDLEAQYTSRADAVTKKMQEQLEAEQSKAEKYLNALRNSTLDSAISQACAQHKANVKLLRYPIKERTRIEIGEDGTPSIAVLDDRGSVMLTRKGNSTDNMSLSEFVGTVLKEDPDYASVFEGSGAAGSGRGGTSVNFKGSNLSSNPATKLSQIREQQG